MYSYIHIHIYVYVGIYIYVCMYVYLNMYIYVYILGLVSDFFLGLRPDTDKVTQESDQTRTKVRQNHFLQVRHV
jgi:hypothetical protein